MSQRRNNKGNQKCFEINENDCNITYEIDWKWCLREKIIDVNICFKNNNDLKSVTYL